MKITTLSFVVASALSFTSLTSVALAAPDATATTTTKSTTTTTTKAKPAPLTETEQKAVIHVHHVNVEETTMGKLAGKQGTAGTKKYGAMLVTDHTKSDKELAAFAKKHGLAKIPDEVPTTEAEKADAAKKTDMMASMKTMKGAAFDAMYLQMMVEGHEKELAMQPQWIAGTADADMKAMLDKRTTTLTKHRDDASALLAKASATTGTTAPMGGTMAPVTGSTATTTKSTTTKPTGTTTTTSGSATTKTPTGTTTTTTGTTTAKPTTTH